jgi:glycerol-3-phosphate dehydrogenase
LTSRDQILRSLDTPSETWDVLVIGGGATGLGAAVEAASRGYRTLLIERSDFAAGTSSRSTKLVHGGVRYLQQMNITLVLDALRERGRMLHNAPHLVHDLSFIVPAYAYASLPYYGFGLKLYELLSGHLSLGRSQLLSRTRVLQQLPGVRLDNLRGGILYHDGQFDDARYAIALVRTLQDLGGIAINYLEATGFLHSNGKTTGVHARDCESGSILTLSARVVINAAGVFSEDILALDARPAHSLLALSQGTHFVLPRSFMPSGSALMVPKTGDGRVLFAIPWHDAVLVGTTDEPVAHASTQPRALEVERQFLLDHIARYLGRRPAPHEILSVWSGLRPLIRHGHGKTSQLSRDHSIFVSRSNLVTVVGGKWTTYRRMGQDAIDRACEIAGLPKSPSRTADLKLHGWTEDPATAVEWERVYGADLPLLDALSDDDAQLSRTLHPRLPFRLREVVWAVRHEMARTVEDVLARRTRALFLDAHAAIEAAPVVARLMAQELTQDATWVAKQLATFHATAEDYVFKDA